MKKLLVILTVVVSICLGVYSAPQSYRVALGTNSIVEMDVDKAFQLVDVTATTNGVACNVTVKRIWVSELLVQYDKVTTNLWGTVETNATIAGSVTEEVTNTVYDSTSDTLPTPYIFLRDEVIQADFGSVTGAVLRIVGSDE